MYQGTYVRQKPLYYVIFEEEIRQLIFLYIALFGLEFDTTLVKLRQVEHKK